MAKRLYKKGESGNPNGRPKGSRNRSTEEMRELIKKVVDNNLENLENDLSRMSPANRWTIIQKLSQYFMPTLSKTDNQNNNSGELNITIKYKDDEGNDKQVL